MTQKFDPTSLAARIAALQAKTVANGATEAEALAAAEKARELLDKYQMSQGEATTLAQGWHEAFAPATPNSQALSRAVGQFCDCKIWRQADGPSRQQRMHILGLRSDAEFAQWLLVALDGFVQREAFDYSMEARRVTQEMVNSFRAGAALRISERLQEAAMARHGPQAEGRGLVVVKGQALKDEIDRRGLHFRPALPALRGSHQEAFSAGQASGERAGFGRPVKWPAGSVGRIAGSGR